MDPTYQIQDIKSQGNRFRLSKLSQISLAVLLLMGGGAFAAVGLSQQNQDNRTKAAEAPTIILKPIADAYVDAGTPATNYGKAQSLKTNNGTAAKVTYLKYDLTQLVGRTITGVSFNVRTVGGDGATVDTEYLAVVDGPSWTETGINFSNKPASGVAVVGLISPKLSEQWNNFPLSPAQFQRYVGNQMTLAIVSPGSTGDKFEIASRELVGYEPQLVITYAGGTVPNNAEPTAIPPTLPAATIIPTAGTGAQNGTIMQVRLFLHGLGRGGDSVNANSVGSFNPIRAARTVSLDIYNAQNQLVTSKQGAISFDTASGSFTGNVAFGSEIPSGYYTVKIKTDQYLRGIVPGIQSVVAGQTNILPPVTLTAGDINNDNQVNIMDYNTLVGCYSDLLPAVNCTSANSVLADLTDDRKVNQFDYNFFIRELTNIGGQ